MFPVWSPRLVLSHRRPDQPIPRMSQAGTPSPTTRPNPEECHCLGLKIKGRAASSPDCQRTRLSPRTGVLRHVNVLDLRCQGDNTTRPDCQRTRQPPGCVQPLGAHQVALPETGGQRSTNGRRVHGPPLLGCPCEAVPQVPAEPFPVARPHTAAHRSRGCRVPGTCQQHHEALGRPPKQG